MERNLTTGGVFKNIVYFSLPYLLSYFLQTLYGMADLFITGQFRGVADITAVAIGSQVMHMLTVMIVGLAMGSTVAIGCAVGAGDRGAQEDEKNLLTAEQKCGNINWLLLIRDGPDVKKLLKKVLDKRNEIEYNKNVPPRTACTL